MVVVCNEKRLPIGMLLPLAGHFTQTERFTNQAEASVPLKKQIWKQIIQAKVMAQARALKESTGTDQGLASLALSLKSGDSTNIEAQASRRYWQSLFGPSFRRIPGAEDPLNRSLNYGYAILRAMTARAIVSSGLHPSLGVHHHNKYNPFCLADDLMEPFRPRVDKVVFSLADEMDDIPLDREVKARLVGALVHSRYHLDGDERTLFDVLSKITSSLADVYSGERKRLSLPQV